MIVVTGGAGFIGSNIVHGLNKQGYTNIVVVDDLTDGRQFFNFSQCDIYDYLDKDDFLDMIHNDCLPFSVSAIFHEGACSATTEWDGRYVMRNNYEYSKDLFHYCVERRIPFLYASSAAVYGNNEVFTESRENENPINVYGYSKWQFDQYVRNYIDDIDSLVVGFRYFNVYGPREQHKGGMASVAYHFNEQIKANGECKLFEGTDGYADGEQLRDFVFIGDVVKVNLWFLEHQPANGIYNLGSGRSEPFNAVADAVVAWHKEKGRDAKKTYIPFPEHLKGSYQSYTQADIQALRNVGYTEPFATVAEGVKQYLDTINKDES